MTEQSKLDDLALDQLARMTAGATMWTTPALPEAGVAALTLADGPMGVAGPRVDERDVSLLTPSPLALGASWDTALTEKVGRLVGGEAIRRGIVPFQDFMAARTDPDTLAGLAEIAPGTGDRSGQLSVLIPSFMLSEIQRAFEIGFLIALPFLVIDMIVATIVMSMGMMMLPPTVISLPFKVIFFVLIDGWNLLIGGLVRSFS